MALDPLSRVNITTLSLSLFIFGRIGVVCFWSSFATMTNQGRRQLGVGYAMHEAMEKDKDTRC
jgi:hypothetical protein